MLELAMFGTMLLLMVVGVPVAFSVGAASVAYMMLTHDSALLVIPQRMLNSLDSFPLMAIPFFVLTGRLMNSSGATDRVFDFANKLIGHVKGGLGHVNVLANMIMAGMSGSAVADASGLGQVIIPAMERQGYDKRFSAAVTGCAAIIGPIIPPSIPMVIYGSMVGISVGRLLLGGFLPGVLLGLSYMIRIYYLSKKRNYPSGKRATLSEIGRSFITSLPALLLLVLLIGGIVSGFFTPTEAAAVSALYAFFLGVAVYRQLTLRIFMEDLIESAKTVVVLLMIISGAAAFGVALARNRIPQLIVQGLVSISGEPIVAIMIINVFLLILGCFMEGTAVLIVLGPVFHAIAESLKIDPVFMGVLVVVVLMIGLVTPPVGMVIYVLNRICGISMAEFAREALGFICMAVAVVIILSFFPSLVTVVPDLLMGPLK